MSDIKRIELATFASGAVEELFKNELNKVVENIADLNTSEKKARKIAIEFKFVPMESRDLIAVDISTKTTLAPTEGTRTKMVIGIDGNLLVAAEYNNQVKGQIAIDETEEAVSNNMFADNVSQFKAK